jgi:hypothetical protein
LKSILKCIRSRLLFCDFLALTWKIFQVQAMVMFPDLLMALERIVLSLTWTCHWKKCGTVWR